MRKAVFLSLFLGVVLSFCFCGLGYAALCGNGIVEGLEECDNGSKNSDPAPDACRTNCVLPKCGDATKDSNEECDEGPWKNSDKIPNACRTNCRIAYCGDGVLDDGEECDDKNTDAYDGCHQCQRCYLLKDDLSLSNVDNGEVRLCQGRYEVQDQGQEGVLIVNSSFATVDCQGSTIVGISPVTQAAAASARVSQAAKQSLVKGGNARVGRQKGSSGSAVNSAQQGSSGAGVSRPAAYAYKGTGIVINGQDVVVRNCNVEGFKTGLKLKSVNAVAFNNNLCRNTTDIQSDQSGNYGVKNSCAQVRNWQENGVSGCTNSCP